MDLDNSVFVSLRIFWLSLDMDNWYSKSTYEPYVLQCKVAQPGKKGAEQGHGIIMPAERLYYALGSLFLYCWNAFTTLLLRL